MMGTSKQREAVERILEAGHLTDRYGNRYYAEGSVADAILAWHDGETRALREQIASLKSKGLRTGRADTWDAAIDAAVRVLLTPTPGAGKEVECYCNSLRHYPSQHPVKGCLVDACECRQPGPGEEQG